MPICISLISTGPSQLDCPARPNGLKSTDVLWSRCLHSCLGAPKGHGPMRLLDALWTGFHAVPTGHTHL